MHNNTREIARHFIEAWNAGNDAVVDELAAPDIVVEYTHHKDPIRGIEGYRNMLQGAWAYFPDLAIEAEEPLVDGDRAAVAWVYTGTHQRGEIGGVAPSGKRVRVQGITL